MNMTKDKLLFFGGSMKKQIKTAFLSALGVTIMLWGVVCMAASYTPCKESYTAPIGSTNNNGNWMCSGSTVTITNVPSWTSQKTFFVSLGPQPGSSNITGTMKLTPLDTPYAGITLNGLATNIPSIPFILNQQEWIPIKIVTPANMDQYGYTYSFSITLSSNNGDAIYFAQGAAPN